MRKAARFGRLFLFETKLKLFFFALGFEKIFQQPAAFFF